MKAVTFSRHGGPEVLEVSDVEEPHAGPGQVRVSVRAAGVNPIDWKARRGGTARSAEPDFPVATIADFGAAQLGVKVTGSSDGRHTEALHEAAELARQARLRVTIAGTYPFSQAAEAHRESEGGHVRGKLVLLPD